MLSGHPVLSFVLSPEQARRDADLKSNFGEMVDEAWELAHSNQFADLSNLLQRLIPELERATRSCSSKDAPRLNGLKARAYHAASAAFSRQDEPNAAWIAADRSLAASELSDEPLEVFAGHFRLAHAFLRAKRADQAERVAHGAIEALQGHDDGQDARVASLLGALHLVAAVIASRTEGRERARTSLAEAESLAKRVGDGRNDFHTEFGMTNVLLHRVAVAVELGDAGEALEIASRIEAESLSIERQTRLLVDVAAAHTQRNRLHAAMDALLKAEEMSPAFIHGHPYPREVIGKLLRLQVQPRSQLTQLAERANVQ